MPEQMTANSLLALSRQLENLAEAAAPAVVGIRLHGRLSQAGSSGSQALSSPPAMRSRLTTTFR
jgi:hypothetical protein